MQKEGEGSRTQQWPGGEDTGPVFLPPAPCLLCIPAGPPHLLLLLSCAQSWQNMDPYTKDNYVDPLR